MNLKPITLNGVPAHETLCDVCDGDSFHILAVNGHTHFVCANPVCNETVCQINHSSCSEAKPKSVTVNEIEPRSPSCPYCGSGLIQDGECQKCGL